MNYSKTSLHILTASLFIASGCGTSTKKEEEKPVSALEGSIPLKVGQSFQIKLPANPTGGYGWQYRTELEATHLKEVKRAFQEIPTDQITPEMTGYETWTFTALEKGETSIELVYKQHWREDGPPAKTYFANIIIS